MGELENLIGHFQMQNQQLQAIMVQKQTLGMQAKEIEKALEQIEVSTGDVYRSVGPVLVKTSKDAIKKQLEEEKEDIDIKLKTMENQEKIQGMIPSGQGG